MAEAGMLSSLRHLAKDVLYKPWLLTRHGSDGKPMWYSRQGQDPESHWRTFYSPSVQRGILMQIAEIATAEGGSPYTKNTGEEPSLYQRDDTLGGEGIDHVNPFQPCFGFHQAKRGTCSQEALPGSCGTFF